MRYLLTLSLIAFATAPLFAQPEAGNPIRLTIDPAAEPTPTLRYRLLPEVRDMKSGNAAMLYLRAMAPEWAPEMRLERDKKMQKLLDKWSQNQHKAPPAAFNWVFTDNSLKEIDRAARRFYCDWEQLDRLRKEGIQLLIPNIQSMRLYGRLLAVRARMQLEKRDFRGAMRSMQTCFAMSRHVAEGPTLIHGLVGIAINTTMIEQMEEWIGTPGSPNLYWALTNLPKPFVDLRRAFQGERITMDWLLPGVRDAYYNQKPMPLDQALATAHRLADTLEETTGLRTRKERGTQSNFLARAGIAMMAAAAHADARRTLLKQGWKANILVDMPVVELWLLYEMHNFDRYYDNFFKWQGLPFWQAQQRMTEEYDRYLDEITERRIPFGMILGKLLLPALQKVHAATVRPDRRIAAARCIEAIRLYAAKHGKLPAKLSDIKNVPIPIDPATGKSFLYEKNGNRCVLRTHVNIHGSPPSNVLRYELTLRVPKN